MHCSDKQFFNTLRYIGLPNMCHYIDFFDKNKFQSPRLWSNYGSSLAPECFQWDPVHLILNADSHNERPKDG